METTAKENSEEALCPSCMRGNAVKAHFCGHCRAPLDSFAATDPIGSIYAEFDTLGKASHKPHNVMVLIGMWMIVGGLFLLPAVGFLIHFFGAFVADCQSGDLNLTDIAGIVFWFVVALVPGFLLWRTTANYFGKGANVEEEEKNDGLAEEALAGGGDGDEGDAGG